ncbi:MAG: hypothetical protein JOY93_07365 [Acidobacteriales bacterium]|nr:hypothetical protein [Terriglobales bacterium]
MSGVPISLALAPATIALLMFLVFTYLYRQGRQPYFRAWQLGWAAYTLHCGFNFWPTQGPSAIFSWFAALALVAMAVCISVSARLLDVNPPETPQKFRLKW